jgi:hypothetical protein
MQRVQEAATGESMIYVNLCGGIGNTFFQYNFARALSFKHEVALLNSCNQYGCQLERFNITLPILPHPGWRWIAEKSLRYDPNPEIENNAIIAGYWQTEKYFLEIADTIRAELTLREPLSPFAKISEKLINATPNSVAVHVRHGDYCTWAAQRHGVLPMRYYLEAAEHFTDPHFFLFSDDHTCGIPLPHTRIDCSPHEDLYLMSLCKHAIIANSSFSWHSAWLGADKCGGKVIAPKQWFKTGNEDSLDIIPDRWLRI